MDDAKRDTDRSERPAIHNRALRALIAVLIGIPAAGYTAAVLAGDVAPNRQLSGTHLILLVVTGIAIVLIVWPQDLGKISSLSAGGVRVDLRAVQDSQKELAQKQEEYREILRLIYPLLLPSNMRNHLRTLEAAQRGVHVADYNGSDPLREELRRLQYMQLIEMIPPHRRIADIPYGKIKLPEFVRLTRQGTDWIVRAQELGIEGAGFGEAPWPR